MAQGGNEGRRPDDRRRRRGLSPSVRRKRAGPMGINNYAANFLAGIRAYAEGKMWYSPSFAYLLWATHLAWRARANLRKKGISVKVVPIMQSPLQQPALFWRFVNRLPLIDWLALVVPGANDVFWGHGKRWGTRMGARLGPLSRIMQITSFTALYILYLPIHPFFLFYSLGQRLKEAFSVRNEESTLSDSPPGAVNVQAQARTGTQLRSTAGALLFVLATTSAPFVDALVLQLLLVTSLAVATLEAVQHLSINRQGPSSVLAFLGETAPRSLPSALGLRGRRPVETSRSIDRRVRTLATMIVSAEEAMAAGRTVTQGELNGILTGSPLNLAAGTNMMGPEFVGYLNDPQLDVHVLAHAITEERGRRPTPRHRLTLSAARMMLLSLSAELDKRGKSTVGGEGRAGITRNGHLLYAPDLISAENRGSEVTALIATAKSLDPQATVFLAGSGDGIAAFASELRRGGLSQTIEFVDCETIAPNGFLNLDAVLGSFGQQYPHRLGSTTLALPNRNYFLSPHSVKLFDKIRVVMLIEDALGGISMAEMSLHSLLNLDALSRTLTSA